MGMSREDHRYMAHALALGRRMRGRTWPNPSVGCVLVRDGVIVGRGSTGPGGTPHAESAALDHAGESTRGATAYVTLEPCAHVGRTGPCARRLVDAGVTRVVTAIDDPDPRVSGKGHDLLAASGIRTDTGCLAADARAEHRGFLNRVRTGLPALTLKLAMSYDGKVAAVRGEPSKITGRATRDFCHMLRSIHDAVLIGSGTADIDDPRLNVRIAGIDFQPVRVVIDSDLSLNPQGRLAGSADDQPLWICHGASAPRSRAAALMKSGAVLIECMSDGGSRIALVDVLQRLALRGMNSIFCEGGPLLATSLLTAGRVDVLYGFTAGRILGLDAVPATGAIGPDLRKTLPGFMLQSAGRCGNDSICCWTRILNDK